MSDEPFQRPGTVPPPTKEAWPYESPSAESVFEAPDVSMPADHDKGRTGTPSVRPARVVRFRAVVVLGVVALPGGVFIGAVAIETPAPAAVPITVDSFPRELLGETRDDVAVREGGSETAIESLDDHFQAQLEGYRFAYGGEGAEFGYGESYRLTIVNGQLAPELPISGDAEWATSSEVSLNSRDTSCVFREGILYDVAYESKLPIDPVLTDDLRRETEVESVWTDCVLFDRQRNLGLRLQGQGPGSDVLKVAGQFRDELQRIHIDLSA